MYGDRVHLAVEYLSSAEETPVVWDFGAFVCRWSVVSSYDVFEHATGDTTLLAKLVSGAEHGETDVWSVVVTYCCPGSFVMSFALAKCVTK